MALILANVVP
uniref:Uncharacterized protein n=1 Tax=Anguilla anguilla TaxID=7936 RepID=A0A0E9XVG9_ANGAN